jgi:hypothetical protein
MKEGSETTGCSIHGTPNHSKMHCGCISAIHKPTSNGGDSSSDGIPVPSLAQVDDACMWFVENQKAHTQFPNQALSVKLEWTINCLEEQDVPWQTMLGAMDHYFCVLINVGLWLEVSLGFPGGALNPYVFGLSQNMEFPAGGMKSKGWAQDQCCEYFMDAPFDNEKGPLSTHSLRKYSSTYCCNNGVS